MADFTYVASYFNKIYDAYVDEHEIVMINEKQPIMGKIGTIVAGDSKSQFMTFEINRYYDGIDLSNKMIKINYVYEVMGKVVMREGTSLYSDDACNICCNDKKLRFSWLLPSEAALKKGTLGCSIVFIGEDGYNFQTEIFELTIQPSITNDGTLEQVVKVDWFTDIESRLYKVEQATGGVDLDYSSLINKPSINGTELNGDMELDFISGKASSTNLGGVKAIDKNASMTQAVGIDSDGYLWVQPSAGGSGVSGGADGFSPIVTITPTTDGNTLAILDKNGLKTTEIKNGTNGTNGVSITDVEITADNKITISSSVPESYEVASNTKIDEIFN